MNRDTVKTLAGLLVIGAIVVATFLYGNAQRQSQLKHDQNVKNQQASSLAQAPSTPDHTASAAPAGTNTPQATASSKPAGSNGTAAVTTPAQNTLQGGKTTTPSVSPTPKPSASPSPTAKPAPTATPAQTGQVAGAQTTPVTGGSATPLPQTGPAEQLAGVIGLAAIATMILWLRRSKRAVFTAARGNRSHG
jgi:hypothetical protein